MVQKKCKIKTKKNTCIVLFDFRVWKDIFHLKNCERSNKGKIGKIDHSRFCKFFHLKFCMIKQATMNNIKRKVRKNVYFCGIYNYNRFITLICKESNNTKRKHQ